MECLFVYGTLRRTAGHPMHRYLSQHATFVGSATCQGRLYRISSYPGVVMSDNPAHRVVGEVYRLHEPSMVLPHLDRYEECGPEFPANPRYVRQQHTIRLDAGEMLTAWIYLYNRPVAGLPVIASGDFLADGTSTA